MQGCYQVFSALKDKDLVAVELVIRPVVQPRPLSMLQKIVQPLHELAPVIVLDLAEHEDQSPVVSALNSYSLIIQRTKLRQQLKSSGLNPKPLPEQRVEQAAMICMGGVCITAAPMQFMAACVTLSNAIASSVQPSFNFK